MNIQTYTRKHTEAWGLLERYGAVKPTKRGLSTRTAMSQILLDVAEETGECVISLKGHRRTKEVARARQLFMKRAYDEGFPMAMIGRFLNRDHTTIIHGIRRIDDVRSGKLQAIWDAEYR